MEIEKTKTYRYLREKRGISQDAKERMKQFSSCKKMILDALKDGELSIDQLDELNPGFTDELRKFGAFDLNACYNCGSCTAICSLSNMNDSFPREMLRFSVLGLQDEIKSSLKPWLCYNRFILTN